MLRAVTYCRCSTEEESQKDALQQQVIESRKSVQQQGWTLVDEFIEARSGTTTAKRNEYNRLYEQLQTDQFDIVVIKSQDRLMRNTKDWYLFVDRLVNNGKRLFMYLEQKFYSADDALITGIKAILAEEYSKELSKKINNAHFHRQRDGGTFILPSQTYGLKRDENGEIVIVEEEAEAIRIMFFLCRSMGCNSIEHYLEENGIRDRNGKAYKEEAIRRIIRNPIRYGTVIQNKRHFDFQTKKMIRMPADKWIVHKDAVPAIVSESEWKAANEAMDNRAVANNQKKYFPRGNNPGKYQLSGKIRCGECGSPFYRRYRKRYKDKKLIVEWKCQRYVQNGRNQDDLRREKIRTVNLTPGQGCDNIHLDEERLFQLLERVSEQYYNGIELDYAGITEKMMKILTEVLAQNDSVKQKKQIQKEKFRYEQQGSKLLNKLLDEVISDDDYKRKKQEIDQKIEKLNLKLGKLKDAEAAQMILEQRLDTIRKRLEGDTIKKATVAEMVDSIDTILVFPTKLVITYKPEKVLGVDSSVLDSIENATQQMEDRLQIEVPFEEDFLYATKKEAQRQRIVDYMIDNPKITARQIAELEQISLSASNARIRKLKQQGKIRFEGSGGRGQWIVITDADNEIKNDKKNNEEKD